MFLEELAAPQLLVIYPGRFQPFHKGHYAVYNWLSTKFGRNNVYIVTTNKTDNLKSPFNYAEKTYFMQLTGVPADRIIQASNPYQIESIMQGGLTVHNPSNTVLLFAVSEKDMAEDPRFKSWTKKDGSPAYFQPLTDIKQTESMEEHGYIMTVPTFDFEVLGHPMRSASELRKLYAVSDEKNRQYIIRDLFGKYTREAEQIMNSKIPAEQLAESKHYKDPELYPLLVKAKQAHPVASSDEEALALYTYDTEKKDVGHVEKEESDLNDRISRLEKQFQQFVQFSQEINECGGVGVVKGGNDPRYMTATMGDQNDVNSETLSKSMQAYNLVSRKNPGKARHQKNINRNVGKGRGA